MTNFSRNASHGVFLLLLMLAALCLPLPLYLVALAVFGLPHVIWEMAFLRSRYAGRWSPRWWFALGAVLLIQAGVRGALWLGSVQSPLSQVADLLALLLLGLIVAMAPKGAGWRVRAAGLCMAVGVLWLLEQGDIWMALLLLAMAHNFTPLALAWDMASEHRSARPLAWLITVLFVLPVLVVGSGWTGASAPSVVAPFAALLDGQLPQSWGGSHRQAMLSAIVLAQCLHYYCVIYLLPHAQAERIARPLMPSAVRKVALLAAVLLSGYFISDYSAARKLYAVAAGVHAWLEWPVLLMAFLGMSARHPFRLRQADPLR